MTTVPGARRIIVRKKNNTKKNNIKRNNTKR